MIQNLERTVDAAPAVVTLAEAKQFLKVDTSEAAEEALIQSEIDAATKWVEDYCSISLGEYSIKVYTTDYTNMFLDYGPVKSSPAVTVQDVDSNAIQFYLFGGKFPRVEYQGVDLETYVVSYSTEVYTDGIAAIKEAILQIIKRMYDNRGESTNVLIEVIIPKTAQAILDPHRKQLFV